LRRHILTGAPGAGKTTLIQALAARGLATVAEAATDVIAVEQAQGVPEPWTRPQFVETIARLQVARQAEADGLGLSPQFHDRSVVCTHALAVFLEVPVPDVLSAAIVAARAAGAFERTVFLIETLGFVTPTAARRIGLAEALRFEAVHVESYRRFGYDLLSVPAGPVEARLDFILQAAAEPASAS
jgi:predicted ATPase